MDEPQLPSPQGSRETQTHPQLPTPTTQCVTLDRYFTLARLRFRTGKSQKVRVPPSSRARKDQVDINRALAQDWPTAASATGSRDDSHGGKCQLLSTCCVPGTGSCRDLRTWPWTLTRPPRGSEEGTGAWKGKMTLDLQSEQIQV